MLLLAPALAFASAYNGQPKLVVIIIIDQFRADLLDRAHDRLGPSGLRFFTDRGAWFTNCNYNYANTETAPGHATLLTGSYTNAHGILANTWWDPTRKNMVMAGSDPGTQLLGGTGIGYSPRVLTNDTLGDELKTATYNRSRVFAISLKPRSAVLPGGFTANAAYWIDPATGHWQSSTYYMPALPSWVVKLNASGRAESYWNQEWKSSAGAVLERTTKPSQPGPNDFFVTVGSTPMGNDWELEMARTLVENEKLGAGPATDLLIISLSANDLLGHEVGPNSRQSEAMTAAIDTQLSGFFGYLAQRIGLTNVWLVLSADHGVAPAPEYANKIRLPGAVLQASDLAKKINASMDAQFSPGRNVNYFRDQTLSHWFLDEAAFTAVHLGEAKAERAVCDALLAHGVISCFTRAQLAAGDVPPDDRGHRYLHSYSPYGGWWVIAAQPPFAMSVDSPASATHGSPFYYDTHVPLAFFGQPFQPGVYRGACEPIDMTMTLANLLGINATARAQGRVLSEALRQTTKENPK